MELLEGEVFKPLNVEGYEKYLVSNKGRVWNGKFFMKQTDDKDGYKRIKLCSGGVNKTMIVHRMVCLTFKFDSYEEGLIVNHIDSNPQNNDLDNLEWVTYKQNTWHGIKAGNISIERIASQSKFAASKSKEKISIPVELIKGDCYTVYESISSCSKETGLSFQTIKKYLNGDSVRDKSISIEYA